MRAFAKFDHYGPDPFDEPMRGICDALNSLPGIRTTGSCCGHGKQSAMVFFDVDGPVGLSFLVRCMDRRYFKHGDKVRIDLSISDSPPTRVLYCLETRGRYWDANGVAFKGQEAYDILDALVENMLHHLNHEAYSALFDLDTFAVGAASA